MKQACSFIPFFAMLLFIQLASQLASVSQSKADPTKPCFVCSERVGELASVTCEHGHTLDSECLQEQLRVGENETHKESMSEIARNGFPCLAKGCKGKIPFDQFLAALPRESQDLIHQRIAAEQDTDFLKDISTEREIQFLHRGILQAATLSCPAQGCHNALGPKDACCAATCLSKDCQRTFCYLCFKLFGNSKSAESHVSTEHTGQTSFENRPGRIERYHWLKVRESMEVIFSSRIHPKVRELVLQLGDVRQVLQDKKMWPFPAGISTQAFQVNVLFAELSKEQKIELLQNEFIFLFKRDPKGDGVRLLAHTLQQFGAKVLASLDAKDSEGLSEDLEHRATRRSNHFMPFFTAQALPLPLDEHVIEREIEALRANVPLARVPLGNPDQAPVAPQRFARNGAILDTPPALVRRIERKLFDRNIPRAFDRLGPMHAMISTQTNLSIVWSSRLINPNTRNERGGHFDFSEASTACNALRGARLPTYEEAQEITNALPHVFSDHPDELIARQLHPNPNAALGRFLGWDHLWTDSHVAPRALGEPNGTRVFSPLTGAVSPANFAEVELDLFNAYHATVCVLSLPKRTLMTYLTAEDQALLEPRGR